MSERPGRAPIPPLDHLRRLLRADLPTSGRAGRLAEIVRPLVARALAGGRADRPLDRWVAEQARDRRNGRPRTAAAVADELAARLAAWLRSPADPLRETVADLPP